MLVLCASARVRECARAALTPGHDIIVIGGSAGAVQPLRRIVQDLPPDLPAAVFIVLHVGRTSILADILARSGTIRVVRAESGAEIVPGTVYVAPPGRHLLLHEQHILLRRGPHENLARPAIDPLFRSAAATFGARVVGVVLSGALNDGTAGLHAVKRCGGIAVVQDPADADVGDMPRSALRRVAMDHCVAVADMSKLLARLASTPPGPTPPIPPDIRLEATIAAQELATMASEDRLGTPSRFACPECHGALWEIDDGAGLRYRCHVGHAYSGEAMEAAQADRIEETLWILMRAHQERAALVRRLAGQAATPQQQADYRRRAEAYQEDAEIVGRFILDRSMSAGSGGLLGDDAV